MLQKPESVFDLKWNNFTSHLEQLSTSLLQDTSLLDISIQCGPELVRAHKLVLSACSPWFRDVFSNMPANPSPLVVLWETKMVDMKNILSFMYNGEVQVEQDSLLSFLKLAGYLQVKGLTEGNEKEEEGKENVLVDEKQMSKKPKVDDARSPIEEPKARENSRPNSRMTDGSRSRKETASESRLRKEDFELKETKQKGEQLVEVSGKQEKNVLGKSDFDIKSDYERSKVREIRLKEAMKNAGKDKSLERQQKKKTNLRKESLGQQLKALQTAKNSSEKPKETKVSDDYEEHMLQAMLERKTMLEKISNGSLSRFETSNEEENSFENDYNPDFDPSLLVKTEIDETMEEEVVDTSGPGFPFTDSNTFSKPSSDSLNTFSKPSTDSLNSYSKPSTSSSVCTVCNKGPIAKMSQHMKNVHSEITYECKTCIKTFKCERYLQNHKRQYCPDRFKQ